MPYFIYILKSLKNGTYYVGSAKNPEKRLIEHNLGRSVYSAKNRPYKLVFKQEYGNISTARLVEKKIKSWKRKDFIEKIIKDGNIKYRVVPRCSDRDPDFLK